MSVYPFAKACDRRVWEVALWQTGINRGYHQQSKEIGERKFTDLLKAYHIVGASPQRKRKRVCARTMLERNAMHRQRKTCSGMERTENKVAEEDQNGNEKGVERIGHVKEHYMP
jgi:hypothetical protein